jgi:hypothetical protein
MAGAFRDDDLAARQRADALEQRVQALEAEKQALTEQLARKPYTPSQKKALPIALLPLLLGGLLLLATGATAGRVPVRFLAGGVVLLAAVLGAVMMRQLLRARPGELWVISGGPATPAPGRQRGGLSPAAARGAALLDPVHGAGHVHVAAAVPGEHPRGAGVRPRG